MKSLFRLLVRLLFRFRAYNVAVLDTPGPVLLIPNHTSWLDWLFLYVVLDDDWKFVTSSTTAETSWIHKKMMVNARTFPVDTSSPYAVKRMAEYLASGGRLVLFAEGRISLTGSLMKLFDGTGFLIHKTGAKVITAYLRGAKRLRWVKHKGWTKWFPTVTAHFSEVLIAPKLPDHSSNVIARQKRTTWLRDAIVRQQFETEMEFGPHTVLAAIAETAGNIPGKVVLEDFTLTELTYRKLMVGADVLAAEWNKRWAMGDGRWGEHVGVLLPNLNAAPVAVLSLWAAGKVPALLNFSTGTPVMLQCSQLAGLKRIITSRAFVGKAKLKLEPLTQAGIELVYLEDVRAGISPLTKLTKLVKHTLSCGSGFNVQRPTSDAQRSTTAIILFTSGSEGVPKGVELTHANLLANVRQLITTMDLTDDDRFFNAMPLFHSFGLTGCTLYPLVRGLYSFLYPSPLHYRMVPAVVYDRACTILLGTNTFLNGYARKAHPYDFSTVKYLVAGAEKVQEATANVWARKFGVRLLEGYGATECSPAICLNTRVDLKFGSVGRFLPGMEWRLEPVEGVAEGGRLFVRGPNIMKGYLNPEPNAKFLALDGWYDTGDMVRVDDDGYVFILGRLKRFAKISGEMVSLTAVEDALAGAFPQFGLRCEVAAIAVHDEDKGEKLIAITNEPRLTLDDLRQVIKAKGLTNLCAPREIRAVREIPKLGTGKVNHRALLEEFK
jgi:acyl-[acyl-carrier-protein]-phospholipid O-acyltransferase / long-chain-fatty-acid--[acyl-carrier-protein] ligase